MFEEIHDLKADLKVVRSMVCRRGPAPIECPIDVPLKSENFIFAAEEELADKDTFDKFVSFWNLRKLICLGLYLKLIWNSFA